MRCMAAAARGPHGQAGSCRCHVGAMPLVGMEAIPVAPRLHSFVALELEDKVGVLQVSEASVHGA